MAFRLAKNDTLCHAFTRNLNPTEIRSEQPSPSRTRNAALDGLRGIAIAMVLWNHFVVLKLPFGTIRWLDWLREGTMLSWAGVDLFFVLSGYLIGGILIDQRESRRLIPIFYLRRAVRILPLYYVTLAVIGLAVVLRYPGSFHLFPSWVYLFFLTNFAIGHSRSWDWLPLSVMWSLAVEEQFYLTAPWAVRAIRPSWLPWCVAALVAIAEFGRIALLIASPQSDFYIHVLTPLRMDPLALGILAAWAARDRAAEPFIAHLSLHWRFWVLAGAALLCGLVVRHPAPGSADLVLFGYILIAAEFALVVLVVAKVKPNVLNRVLESRFLVSLGRLSYFIYLWHSLVGDMLFRLVCGPSFVLDSMGSAAVVALAVALTWGASLVSWKWFEGPIVSWGHRHAY
jgi:peptidoglycan/LPS O-acetylase OafA/YrhL